MHVDRSLDLFVEFLYKLSNVLGYIFQVQALRDSDIVIAHENLRRDFAKDIIRKSDLTQEQEIDGSVSVSNYFFFFRVFVFSKCPARFLATAAGI
jgi:hypothetical protein